jgi:hypothetical protein
MLGGAPLGAETSSRRKPATQLPCSSLSLCLPFISLTVPLVNNLQEEAVTVTDGVFINNGARMKGLLQYKVFSSSSTAFKCRAFPSESIMELKLISFIKTSGRIMESQVRYRTK